MNHDLDHEGINRRQFMRRAGATTLGAGAAYYGGSQYAGSPVQNGQAVVPLIAGAVVAASVGLGWALREYEVIGSNPPAEGLTAGSLKQQVYQTTLTRQSTNASTILDNQNILDGVKHTAYIDAKIAAIEQLDAGVSESEVQTAAQDAVSAYLATVQSNLLKTWNESVRELYDLRSALQSHPDVGPGAVLDSDAILEENGTWPFGKFKDKKTRSITLFDGSAFQLESVKGKLNTDTGDWYTEVDPLNLDRTNDYEDETFNVIVSNPDGGNVKYLDGSSWKGIYDEVSTVHDNVLNGISTWVTNVYGSVQSGDIEISDLVTPRERAAMMSEGEGTSQAIADLISLNIPVDLEREATITISDTGATLPGTFGLTNSSDGPIESGTTYEPSTFAGDVYFTADMSLVSGDWTAYETGLDGGTITITEEPYEGTAIEVTTAVSETVSVPAVDWTDNGDGTWSYDASAELETNITNVESARFVATATETQYETLQLDGQFTVDKLMNTESGEEVSKTSFSNSQPQTDDNYITQEEWDDLEQQNQELIEKYEESQNNGGAMMGISSLTTEQMIAGVVGTGVAAFLLGK
jgi:hypothetical protein